MKTKGKIVAFLIWQVLLILFLLSVLIWRIVYLGLIEPMPVFSFDPKFVYGIDISKERLDTAIGNVMYIYTMVLIILIVAGCIGLISKKNWGCLLSVLSMSTMFVFILWGTWLIFYYPITNMTIDLILPAIILLIFAVGCSLSILYISKAQAKGLFT